MAKTTKKPLAFYLDLPEVPEFIFYLWEWYLEISNGSAISYQELQAWSELTCKDIQPQEVEILKALDYERWKS